MEHEQGTRSTGFARKHGVLIAVNAGLAAVVGVTAMAPAQPGNERARGQYAIVGGEFLGGGGENAVFILDSTNQDLIAVRWDRTRQSLAGIGYRDLSLDAQERPGR
ncbi:MAG: hypothetical protein AAFR96_01675 [Planctomycetota bacterium]